MKEAIIVTGLPASGKTTYINTLNGYVVLDKDNMRPQWMNGNDEAIKRYKPILRDIFMKQLGEVIEREERVAIETVGDNVQSLDAIQEMLDKGGYSIETVSMNTQPAIALFRSQLRRERVTPLSYFIATWVVGSTARVVMRYKLS